MGKPSKGQRLGRVPRSGRKFRIAVDADQHSFHGPCHTCGAIATHGKRTDFDGGFITLRSCPEHAEADHVEIASLSRRGDHGRREPEAD